MSNVPNIRHSKAKGNSKFKNLKAFLKKGVLVK